jgi:8-hydroxy-5-deazaflavin:NADPH oxidoreductase
MEDRKMKIGIVGATGNFGRGLAYRWAKNHTIYIGSRFREKGEEKAKQYRSELEGFGVEADLIGSRNEEAVVNGDIIVLAIHLDHMSSLFVDSGQLFRNKILISPIVPLKKEQSFQYEAPPEGSAALFIQKMLPLSYVVSGLHTVPAHRLYKLDKVIEGDVPICSNYGDAKETVINLVREIKQLNPIDAGPLEVSKMIEPIVPLILNLKHYGLKKNTCIKFI